MEIYDRFFQLEEEWSVVHIPYKPNGFGVLILGDRLHFVEEQTSFWMQHHGRKQLLSRLRSEGYTLFQSNLSGIHWGSPRASALSKLLIHTVLKKEILNGKIHLLTEGMGSLTAIELMESIPEKIRSVAMFNPCLDLKGYIDDEKANKFFYKRLIKEIAKAYEVEDSEALQLPFTRIEDTVSDLPVRIWQRMNGSSYPYQQHSRKYEEWRNSRGCPIELSLHVGDHFYRLHDKVIRFYKQNEKML